MPPAPNNPSGTILICDTNVVIMMTLFKPKKMFDATYSQGTVEVHDSVIEELERWLKSHGAKQRRLGHQIIQDAIDYASAHTGRLRPLPPDQLRKSLRYLSSVESRLESESQGQATSDTDRTLIAVAHTNKAAVASQDRALRALASKSLGAPNLSSFEEMVTELFHQGVMTTDEIRDGLDNLARFGENLRTDGRRLVLDLINEQPPRT